MTAPASSPLLAALDQLRVAVASCAFPLELPAAHQARRTQQSVTDQLSDYILPRLSRLDAPLLVVVGGSTGAGKSTLVNSLVGRRVSQPGVLRPTTRSPVLVLNPEDRAWFASNRVLPGLARTTGTTGTAGTAETPGTPGTAGTPGTPGTAGDGTAGNSLQLATDETVPLGLALLDAPDVDSVVTENREMADQLLAAADLWLFVTSAARYADAVPWGFLRRAVERTVAVALVLDRVAPQAIDEISAHLREMLDEQGLGQAPLFVVPEVPLDDEGLIPLNAVMPLRIWLGNLAADSAARAAVVRQTLEGAIVHLIGSTPSLVSAHVEQLDAIGRLRADADRIYRAAGARVTEGTADGSLLRGEVLARWQEFVGTGELLRSLERRIGWLRDKLSAALRGRPAPENELTEAVETGLEAMLRAAAESAAEQTSAAWRQTPAGTALLEQDGPALEYISPDFRETASRAIRDWQGYVMQLVREEGSDKRSVARVLAYGVNGIGVTLMIVVFASTAGVTGAEFGVAGGTAVVGQKLLEAIFGDQAVRTLAARARKNLDARVEALLGAELLRYLQRLDALGVYPDVPERLAAATDAAAALR
ncbi:MAG: ABC transporter [Geodermatophilaceae bacterium]|nr:ABC transporter [Geodermatophilaceae bacterium]